MSPELYVLPSTFRSVQTPQFLLPEKVDCPPGAILPLAVDGFTVYNTTAPYWIGNRLINFARVEPKNSERGKIAAFWRNEQTGAYDFEFLDIDEGQDPAIARIHGEDIMSKIDVTWETKNGGKECATNWKTAFYTLDEQLRPTLFAYGPDKMKDIRLVERSSGKIGVMLRPTAEHIPEARGGRIAYCEVDAKEDLGNLDVSKARMINLPVLDDEWVGANQVIEVDGLLWVLGHVARWEGTGTDRIRHYDAMAFVYDPVTRECSEMEIIATWEDFMCPFFKNEFLRYVIFSGGFTLSSDLQRMMLYVGLNDAGAGMLERENVFLRLVTTLRQRKAA